jgi:ATP-dependent RNA helicase MSS116
MGFRDDIEAITRQLPPTPERQTLLFSATVSRSVQQVARATLAQNHEYINCVSEDDSPVHAHVTQYHTVVPNADQQIPHLLCLLAHDQLSQPTKSKVIVFLPTTRMVQLFTTLLRELAPNVLPSGRNTNVYEIHSKRTQDSRTNTSDRFRQDKSGAAILVTSDVSARGVDYPGVTRVIQVGIPQSTEQYIHRVGRTGRGGTTGGRGDLVLLPWEIGFVTWQLTQVPLKPLTTEHLRSQVTELADKFDASPEAFFEGTNVKQGGGVFDRRGRRDTSSPQMFAAPYTPKLLEQENALKDLLAHADEEAVKETMASMLGYYISKTPELRVRKEAVVEGLKNWAVEACKLPVPPYISPGFLERLGLSDNRTKHFSRTYRDDYKSPASRQDRGWGNRGSQGHNGRGRGGEGGERRINYDLQEGDPQSDADEYRTPRFGRKQWSSNKGTAEQDFRSHRDEGDSLRGGRGRGRY